MAYSRIRGLEDLASVREKTLDARKRFRSRVLICMTGCRAMGAVELCRVFREKLAAARLDREVEVVEVGCLGQCARAPLLLVEPQDFLYGGVRPEDVDEIIERTFREGKPVERLCAGSNGQLTPAMGDIPFSKNQRREVLANCGRVDPKRIEDSIARGAYAAAAKVLTGRKPQEVIDEVTASGLRGRGPARSRCRRARRRSGIRPGRRRSRERRRWRTPRRASLRAPRADRPPARCGS